VHWQDYGIERAAIRQLNVAVVHRKADLAQSEGTVREYGAQQRASRDLGLQILQGYDYHIALSLLRPNMNSRTREQAFENVGAHDEFQCKVG
jgi:hypothetical protein